MAQVPDTDVSTVSVGGSAYTVPFIYQNRSEVFVEVDGVSTAFTWINDGNISITPAPAAGAIVRRYRSTSALQIRHDYRNGVPFTPKNIAENNDQLLFVVQESVNDTAGTAALALDTAELAVDTAQSALDLVGERTQYMVLGPYGPGLYFQTNSQVFSYLGEFYSPGPSITLPYTTTGAGAAEVANFRSVGDAVLRQDLANTTTPLAGAALIGRLPLQVNDVAELRATPGRFAGDRAHLKNYLAGDGKGRRGLTWVASAAPDDGGMRFAAAGGHWLSDLNADGRVDAQFYGLPLASGSCIAQDAAIEAYCFANKVSAWYGPGVYDYGDNNWSWSGIRTAGNALKDYGGVRIYSTPLATFRTTSVGGADVMQCCGIKNFGVIGYPKVTAILNNVDDTLSGSNALSLVFGAVDCVFELTVEDMPGIYKNTGAIDGGQGFSIQPGAGNTNPYSNIILRGSVNGATQGFGCDFELDDQVALPLMGIHLDLDIADCYRGVAIAGAAATVPGQAYIGITGSVRVRNCQQSYINLRSLGTNLDVEVVNTLPKESLVKHAFNPSVVVTNILASKDGAARVYGRVLTVDTLLNIGGTPMGGGQFGSTENFTLDHAVAFSGATNQVVVVDSGGNAVDKCRVSLSHITTGYADLSTKGGNTVQVNGTIIAPTAYPGDASIAAVAGPSFKAVYTVALGGVRAVLFPASPRQGDTVRVVRLASATGGGVSVGGLMNILPGTWAEATYNGVAWAITGQGAV